MLFDKDLPYERWAPIPSEFFSGYEVSTLGRVRRPYKRDIYYKADWLLVPTFKYGSKESLVRMKNGVRKAIPLAKLVCAVFNELPAYYKGDTLVENIELKAVVKNETVSNPYFPDNLCWATTREKTPTVKHKTDKIVEKFDHSPIFPVMSEFKTVWRPRPESFD